MYMIVYIICMYIMYIYNLNSYEDKYFISLFAHFKHKARIYTPILHIY